MTTLSDNQRHFVRAVYALVLQLVVQLGRENPAALRSPSTVGRFVVAHATAALGGLYAADLLTAVVHIVLDHVVTPGGRIDPESLPVDSLLRKSAELFQQHHHTPTGIWGRSTTELLDQTAVFWPLPAAFTLCNLPGATPAPWITWQLVLALSAAASQVLHREAHYSNHHPDETSARMTLNRLLQDRGLALSADTHRLHHTDGFHRNFGMVNGWSNPLVNEVYRRVVRRA
jgi:hypothetical protein